MGRRKEPMERMAAKAKGTGRTPGGRELVKASYEIEKIVNSPPTPRGLGRRGKLEWRKVWGSGPWLNPEQDYAWVEQIVHAYDDIDTFRKRVEEDGLVVTGYAGQPVAHPLVAEIRRCEETIRKCLSILGFSPTDRARLGIAEVKRQTALQEFLKASRENTDKAEQWTVTPVYDTPLSLSKIMYLGLTTGLLIILHWRWVRLPECG